VLAKKRKREAHNRKMKKYRQKLENRASIAESNRQYHENNKESNKKRFKQHYEENTEAIKEKTQQHYGANKEAIKEKAQQHYRDNRESIRDAQQQYYKANKESIRDAQQQYYKMNKDIVKTKKREAKIYRSPLKDFGKKRYHVKLPHQDSSQFTSSPPTWFRCGVKYGDSTPEHITNSLMQHHAIPPRE
jgi:hypothetical protein